MTIHNISRDAVAMFIGSGELEREGLDAESLDVEAAAKMARDAFKKAGVAVGPGLEIEAFAGSCGILVFARLLEPEPSFFSFYDFEDMLSAARAAGGADGALYFMDGRWWLRLTRGGAAALAEFGCPERRGAFFAAALEERGRAVWNGGPLSAFAGKFS